MEEIMPKFKDKVIIVTGASEGMGRAVCQRLANDGAKLSLAARNQDRLNQLKDEVEKLGAQALVVPTDVSDHQQCKKLVDKTISQWDCLDVLFNNAGITLWTLFEDIEDLSIFDRIIKTNYLGSVYCTYYALSELKKAKGLVAATSSGIGFMPVTTRTAYCASKYAMFGFFDSLRVELQGSGVGVTVIAPGFVETEIQKRALDRKGKSLNQSPPVDKNMFLSAEKAADMIVSGMEKRKRWSSPIGKSSSPGGFTHCFPRLSSTLRKRPSTTSAGGRPSKQVAALS
jgi:short-subunit dehydrogenase